jgi:hypothetical protein
MAGISLIAGDPGAFVVVPLSGGLLVWCAFLLGSRLGTPWLGCATAAATLAMPVLLFQLFQPMSDVPATAFWLLAVVCLIRRSGARDFAAGLAAGIATLIRPNLAPMLVPVSALASAPSQADAGLRSRLGSVTRFLAGATPGIAVMLTLNSVVYGAPLRSGYGDPSQLFASSHVLTNLGRYSTWLLEMRSPWLLIGLIAPLVVRDDEEAVPEHRSRRALLLTIVAVAVTLLMVYLPYSVFDDWTYLRFLLPALVMLIAAAGAVAFALLRRLPIALSAATVALIASAVIVVSIRAARDHDVFSVWQSEARFVDAATWIERNTPPDSVILTIWHSGSVRYHAHRAAIVWDAIEPGEFDLMVRELEAHHRPAYLLLESWEVPHFTGRFQGATEFARLDWQPRAQIGRDIALYDLAARGQFHRGQPTESERVFTTAERTAFRRR